VATYSAAFVVEEHESPGPIAAPNIEPSDLSHIKSVGIRQLPVEALQLAVCHYHARST
jgi:hypothetical protein